MLRSKNEAIGAELAKVPAVVLVNVLAIAFAAFCLTAATATAESVWVSERASGGESSGDGAHLHSTFGSSTAGPTLEGPAGEQVLPGSPVVALRVPEPRALALQLAAIAGLWGMARRRRGVKLGRSYFATILTLACGLGFVVADAPASAADNHIRYQGFLADDEDSPTTGTRNLGFALYSTAEGGGVPEWIESHTGVAVSDGLFSIVLGVKTPFSPELFSGPTPLWLEISVNGAPLEGRVPVRAVPIANAADGLGGLSAGQWQLRIEGCSAGQVMSAVAASGEVSCIAVTKGPQGDEGLQGLPGPAFELTPESVDAAALAAGAAITEKLDAGSVTTQKLAPDFALDVSHVAGIIEAPTGFLIPSTAVNTVDLEIEGIDFQGEMVVITSGPSADTGRVNLGSKIPQYEPTATQENDFVFEYTGVADAALATLHADYLRGPKNWTLRAMSIIVRDLDGVEVFRWNLFEYGLASIEGTRRGGPPYRYTFVQTRSPNANLEFEMAGGDFGNNTLDSGVLDSNNTATDKRVEIEGINTGSYPAVSVDTLDRTITLAFDWVEGCCIYDWYEQVVEAWDPGLRKAVSIIEDAIPGDPSSEISRRNYFNTFPIHYDNWIGFGLDYKMKARVILSYDYSEEG